MKNLEVPKRLQPFLKQPLADAAQAKAAAKPQGHAQSQAQGHPGAVAALAAETPRLSRVRALELLARRALTGVGHGRHRSAALGSSLDFAEHRDYQPGDDLRFLDWRAWGRTDRLLLRRFHDERQLPLFLILDLSASMAYGKPSKHRQARIIAAALGLLAADQGDAIRLRLTSTPALTPEAWMTGAAAASRLLHQIAHASLRGTGDAAQTLATSHEVRRRSLVVVISDLLGPVDDLARHLRSAAGAGHEVALIQVLDRSELSLPADWGRSLMRDPEAELGDLPCDAADAKAAYDAAMAAHLAAIHQAAAAVRADHVLAPTDQAPADLLARWLSARRRR